MSFMKHIPATNLGCKRALMWSLRRVSRGKHYCEGISQNQCNNMSDKKIARSRRACLISFNFFLVKRNDSKKFSHTKIVIRSFGSCSCAPHQDRQSDGLPIWLIHTSTVTVPSGFWVHPPFGLDGLGGLVHPPLGKEGLVHPPLGLGGLVHPPLGLVGLPPSGLIHPPLGLVHPPLGLVGLAPPPLCDGLPPSGLIHPQLGPVGLPLSGLIHPPLGPVGLPPSGLIHPPLGPVGLATAPLGEGLPPVDHNGRDGRPPLGLKNGNDRADGDSPFSSSNQDQRLSTEIGFGRRRGTNVIRISKILG